MTRRGLSPEERFWMKVEKTESCWNWKAAKNQKGYGLFGTKPGVSRAAHRYSFELANGPIPSGMYIDHICRQPQCVKPSHLRLATAAQNAENQDGHRDSKSGHRGVAFHSQTGKWQVKATKNGVTYTAGLHDDLEVAAEAARLLRLDLMTRNELDKAATK